MDASPQSPAEPSARARAGAGPWGSVAVGLILFLAYMANDREIPTYDTEPTALVTYGLLRGDGPYLDRFEPFLGGRRGRLPEFARRARGHVVSLYP
ncbi:MAG TPA: hypothetical protein VF590_06280, partial [Isosphaeraceae bacterium]